MTAEEKYQAALAALAAIKAECDWSPEWDDKFYRQMLKVKSAYLQLCMEDHRRVMRAK